MKAAKRVVFNTGILYIKILITICVSLYTTRIVLNSLGAEDFGIYAVVGGLVAMLSFLNGAMTSSTQRFLSFSLGNNDLEFLKKVFANSVIIHFVIGIALVVLLEVLGLYFLNYHLKIAPERLVAAQIVFHFVVATTFFTVISVPYDAVINAHENMLFASIVDIIDSLLKLLIAIYLLYSGYDKLLVYAVLMALSSFIIRAGKRMYCKRSYSECHVSVVKDFDKSLVRNMTSFAGWTLFGVLAAVMRTQGISIVLNLFYGTVVNTAYAIAQQVGGQLAFFSLSMMKTIRPQMMKSEGAGERERMLKLSVVASKFSFYLYSFFLIPVFIEMPTVLQFWLRNAPEQTVLFCRIMLIMSLVNQLSMGILSAVQALGNIRLYQLVVGTVLLLTLPVGYLFLLNGHRAESVLQVAVIIECIAFAIRIYYFNRLTSFPALKFLSEAVLTPLVPFGLSAGVALLLTYVFPDGIERLAILSVISCLLYLVLIYFTGMNSDEKKMSISLLGSIRQKIFKR